jgi:hypothetical protein
MRNVLIAVVAAAAIVAARGDQALAMTPAPPAGASAATSFVLPVTNVCGTNGCVRVQTAPPRKRPPPNHRP